MNAAVLSIRLLALLETLPDRASQEVVHRLRTTVRRLEVHLGKCPAKVAKSLKKLRRKAGKVRDIDVHLALLKPALFLRTSAPRKTPSGAREKLREKLREELSRILKAQRDRHICSLREVVAEAAPLLQSKLPMLAERATRNAEGARDLHQLTAFACKHFLQSTESIPEDAERLHHLRIQTKKLRYSLEPLEEYEEAATLAAQFKQVQDAIGSWHDWATLEQLAERELASPDHKVASAMLRARTGREYRKARFAAASVRTGIQGRESATWVDDEAERLIRKVG